MCWGMNNEKTVSAVGNAVTPTNPENVFARGVDAVGDIFDDGANDDSFELGDTTFAFFNPEEAEAIGL